METIKKWVQPAICVISLIALFVFPFVDCDYGYGVGNTFTGFTMAMNTYIGYLLILLPVVLILSNFLPQYASKKTLLSIATPVLCIVCWILSVFFAKTFVSGLADSTLAIGAYITLICYIALLVYAILVYRKEIMELIESLKK